MTSGCFRLIALKAYHMVLHMTPCRNFQTFCLETGYWLSMRQHRCTPTLCIYPAMVMSRGEQGGSLPRGQQQTIQVC